MVGPGLSSDSDMTYLRKIRKPVVEKKRRERMNASIRTLKSLIGQTIKENTSPLTRVDKADILELAVLHLTNPPSAVAAGSGSAAAYNAGYQNCVKETTTFLSEHRLLDDQSMNSLNIHLRDSFYHHGGAADSMGQHNQPAQHNLHNMSTPVRNVHPGTIPFTPYSASTVSPIPYLGYVRPDMQPSYSIGFPHSMVPICQLPVNATSGSNTSTSTNSSSDLGLSSFSLSSNSSSGAEIQPNSFMMSVNSSSDAEIQPNSFMMSVNSSSDAEIQPNSFMMSVNSSSDAEIQPNSFMMSVNSSNDADNRPNSFAMSSNDAVSHQKHDQDEASTEEDADVDVDNVDVVPSPQQQLVDRDVVNVDVVARTQQQLVDRDVVNVDVVARPQQQLVERDVVNVDVVTPPVQQQQQQQQEERDTWRPW